MTEAAGSHVAPRAVLVSRLLHGADGFVQAAETLAERAKSEGYRVAGVHALTEGLSDADTFQDWPDAPPALVIELDSPDLVAAFLTHRPEAAVHLPIRLLLVQDGTWIRLTTVDPTFYRELFETATPELDRRLTWLEVSLDVLLRVLA